MQNEQQKRAQIAKRIITIVVVVIAVVAIGFGFALFLKDIVKPNNQPAAQSSSSQSTTSTALSAASVVSDYTAPSAIQSLSDNYQLQQDSTASSYITYKADNQTYTISVPTTHSALFYAKSTSQPNDMQSVQTQTTSFMQSRSYTKANTSTDPSTPVTTYTNQGSVCQLTSAPTSMPAYYQVACADKADVQKVYSTTQTLLALYQKSHQLDSFTQAISSTITSDNKAMTTISLTTTHGYPILLFAAINNDWAFIGDIGGTAGGTSNGKYVLTPDVKTAIHDPKYGDFLTHNLQSN